MCFKARKSQAFLQNEFWLLGQSRFLYSERVHCAILDVDSEALKSGNKNGYLESLLGDITHTHFSPPCVGMSRMGDVLTPHLGNLLKPWNCHVLQKGRLEVATMPAKCICNIATALKEACQ